MSFFGWFKRQKNDYGDYRMSQHVTCYEKIATYLNTSAQHVYEIAHGKAFCNHDDRVIWHELIVAGIVSE